MAYDPNDPNDKKIVDKLIKEAVDAALEEANVEHDANVKGLKDKNRELLGKLKAAEKGEGDPAEVARLEGEVEALTAKVKESEKALKGLTKERDELKTGFETESNFSRKLLVDNGLTEALVAANVGKQFLPAVKAMLAGQVTLKTEGDERKAFIGDKSLGDYIKEWSQGDDGKHYVSAPANGGAGANGGKAAEGKTMTRAAFEALGPAEQSKFSIEGGKLTE